MAGYLGAGLLAIARGRSAYNQGTDKRKSDESQQRQLMLKLALEEAARRRQQETQDRSFGLQREKFEFEKSKPLPTSQARIDPLSEAGIAARVQREKQLKGIPTYGQAHPRVSSAGSVSGEPQGKPPKAPTESQAKANSFVKIMEAEEPTISDMSNNLGQKYLNKIPVIGNVLTGQNDAKYQAQVAAAERWVTQYLRFQSGATISESEFENAKKQFIPQPGDKPETIQAKAQARARAVQGMREATRDGDVSAQPVNDRPLPKSQVSPTAIARGDNLSDADYWEMLKGEGMTDAMATAKVLARKSKRKR